MVRHMKCLKDAVMPLIWLNCVFCMGVFQIPAHRPRFLLSIVYTFMVVIGYFMLIYEGTSIFQETFNYNLALFYCVEIVNVSVAACSILLFWCKSQKFSMLIKKFAHVDDTLEALGIKKHYQQIFQDTVWCIVMWIACMLLLNIMHIIWMWRDYGYWSNIYITICCSIPVMINCVVDVTFCSFIRCIGWKFHQTNIMINDVVLSANDANVLKIHNEPENTPIAFVRSHYKSNKDMIMHLVQTLKQLHLQLTRIGNDINGAYCYQILMEMAVHFTIITAVCYSLYSALAGTSSRMGAGNEKIVSLIVWGIVYSIKIMVINNLCTTASHEAYKTGEIVQTFEGSFLDDELREEVRQFTEQIILNSLHFTAAGFFRINNALTGSFFATVTTYVVILIQMGTPS